MHGPQNVQEALKRPHFFYLTHKILKTCSANQHSDCINCLPSIYSVKYTAAGPVEGTVLGVVLPVACLLGLQFCWGSWLSVSCEPSVFSGRGLCEWTITRPDETYRVWCV